MSKEKTIRIEFADPRVRAIDCIRDIRDAAEATGLHLYGKYRVQLQYPMSTADDKVVVKIKIPDDIEGFAVGNHLRGISYHMLKNHGDRYRQFLVGKRLLNYIDVTKDNQKPARLAMVDRLEAIVSFTKLLERSDDESLDQIEAIVYFTQLLECHDEESLDQASALVAFTKLMRSSDEDALGQYNKIRAILKESK